MAIWRNKSANHLPTIACSAKATRGELSLKLKSVWEERAKTNLKAAGDSYGRGMEKGSPTLANPIKSAPTTPAALPTCAAVLAGL